MELDVGSDPVGGEESRRVVLPTASRKEPSDRPKPIEPVDSSTLLPKVGVPVESAPEEISLK